MSDETTERSAGWRSMNALLQKVADGSKRSGDLSEDEAYDGLNLCLGGEPSDVQIGIFMAALRLKGPTYDENRGFLRALLDQSTLTHSTVPRVLALCDPYDGYGSAPHFAPVVAAVLGACGLPTYVHGAWSQPPTHGVTARQALQAFGVKLGHGYGADSLQRASDRLAQTGAAYVAVEDFCKPLMRLSAVRGEIPHRPFLSALEKLIVPIRGARETHVCAGWEHKDEELMTVKLLQSLAFRSIFLLKGREGHVDPYLHIDTETYVARGTEPAVRDWLRPKSYGLVISQSPDWRELTAEGVAELWDQALTRKHRELPAQTVRLLAGAMLAHCGLASTIMRGVGMAHSAIINGDARNNLLQMGL